MSHYIYDPVRYFRNNNESTESDKKSVLEISKKEISFRPNTFSEPTINRLDMEL